SWIGFPRLGRGLSHCNPALRCYPPKRRRKPDSGWYSDQSVDGDQALRIMTMGPAYAAFWERDLGALTVGRYADFTVLSADPYQVPTTSLRTLGILMTIAAGRVTFDATGAWNHETVRADHRSLD